MPAFPPLLPTHLVAIESARDDPVWLTAVLSYVVPMASLLAALLAAWYSGRTLQYVKKQIELAKQQITIANDQIKLARDQIEEAKQQTKLAKSAFDLGKREFDATIENLEISRTQEKRYEADRARMPRFKLSFAYPHKNGALNEAKLSVQSDQSPANVSVAVSIANIGPKDATNTRVDVQTSKHLELSTISKSGIFAFQRQSSYGVQFFTQNTVPSNEASIPIAILNLRARWGRHALYVRAYSNETGKPRDGEGWTTLDIILPGDDPGGQLTVQDHPLNAGDGRWP